ncbi:MAG: YceI family protein [Campylobacterales bacterium]|nr:YceI family protein [Campylobacterales bacterium]
MKILMILLAALSLGAAECRVQSDGALKVKWEAYKTPLKAGVKGSFVGVSSDIPKEATSLNTLLEGRKVFVQLKTVESGLAERDTKLLQFFFNWLEGQTAEATVLSLSGEGKEGIIKIALRLNGKTVEVPLRYAMVENLLEARGVIDLADFGALGALSSINKACYELHEGKTWQDVGIGFTLGVTEVCR